MVRHFLIALQFMTVFRLKNDLRENPEELAASVGYYPLVGLVLGGIVAALFSISKIWLSPLLVGFLMVFLLALMTQGLHFDGLADTADAIFSHRDRQRKLEIMKDSHIGVFGVLALIFVIGLKAMLLAELVSSPAGWRFVWLFPVWGRLAVSLTMAMSEYAREEGGLGRPFVNLAGKKEFFGALGTSLVLALILVGPIGLIGVLSISLAALLGVSIFKGQLGGVTGDILGAVCEVNEGLGLLWAVVVLKIV